MKNLFFGAVCFFLFSQTISAQLYTSNGAVTGATQFGINHVGILTNAPLAPLDVNGKTYMRNTLGVGAVPGGYALTLQGIGNNALLLGRNASGQLMAELNTASNVPYFSLYNSSGSSYMVYLSGSGNSYINGGNLGLGTATPAAKLHVMGNSTLEAYEPFITLKNQWQNNPTGNVTSLKFNNGSQDVWKINAQVSGAEEFSIVRRDWNNPSVDIKVLSIKNNEGIVGIGTDNLPLAYTNNSGLYRLYVKGGIKTEEIKVELCSGSWCDYVFAADYQLKSLAEVEQHIAETGHLHNIASAAEIEAEGLELKSITINQQEKIEEIFLHLIEMEKKMKALEAENAALKVKVEELSK